MLSARSEEEANDADENNIERRPMVSWKDLQAFDALQPHAFIQNEVTLREIKQNIGIFLFIASIIPC